MTIVLSFFVLHMSAVLTSFPFPVVFKFCVVFFKIRLLWVVLLFVSSQKSKLLERRVWIPSPLLGTPPLGKTCPSAGHSRLLSCLFSGGPAFPVWTWLCLLLYVPVPGNVVTVQLNFSSVFILPLELEDEGTDQCTPAI